MRRFFARLRSGSLGRRARLLFGAAVALVLGLSGGAAYAFYTGSGSGIGAASVGTPSPVTVVNASGTVANLLSPGSSGDLLVELDNPNSYAVKIVSLSPNGTSTASGGIGFCGGMSVEAATLSGLHISVAPGSNVAVTIPNGATMTTTSESGCQGATFSVPITLTVEK